MEILRLEDENKTLRAMLKISEEVAAMRDLQRTTMMTARMQTGRMPLGRARRSKAGGRAA